MFSTSVDNTSVFTWSLFSFARFGKGTWPSLCIYSGKDTSTTYSSMRKVLKGITSENMYKKFAWRVLRWCSWIVIWKKNAEKWGRCWEVASELIDVSCVMSVIQVGKLDDDYKKAKTVLWVLIIRIFLVKTRIFKLV